MTKTRNEHAHDVLAREARARKNGFARPLLFALLDRSPAVSPRMPAEVRVKVPKRVQEAMQVVEDYVEGRDTKLGKE
ncbi:hypothetical protein [Variovorax sp. DXTD-1]|uniref:hypothetical protein n=1 Tax=Variovorax sp. DXTD-1 TaxID=2495592 RepID=UPI000F86D08F|nr:hypothetical protein [Variovorax sp. DXTD-1]RST45547.1 hypothetical protein EJI00_23710 [Variovorax sp. DXTD-1]